MRNGDRVRLRGVLLDRDLYEQLPPPDRKIEVEKFLDALLTTLDADVNGPDAWETRCITNAINALGNHMYTAALVYAVHALVPPKEHITVGDAARGASEMLRELLEVKALPALGIRTLKP
jgi:hypothetical protein